MAADSAGGTNVGAVSSELIFAETPVPLHGAAVEFCISADGKMTDLSLINSSGFRDLDQMAMHAVAQAGVPDEQNFPAFIFISLGNEVAASVNFRAKRVPVVRR